VALRGAAVVYALMTGFMALVLLSSQPAPSTYLAVFLVMTGFLLLASLLSEAGNSLINPAEAMVLAHQPINGATYTAAKLAHLARIVLFLVPAINAIPALGGLVLKQAGWTYPVIHFVGALVVGSVMALLCCAVYGWLVRLVPASRLKAAAQLVGTAPFLVFWITPSRKLLMKVKVVLPSDPVAQWALGLAVAAGALGIVLLGLRGLSADYLLRVSSIMQGHHKKGVRSRTSRTGAVIARFFGGASARAGFAYVSKMARRDFQFRRQALPMIVPLSLGGVSVFTRDWLVDPIGGRFTMTHLLPHIIGFLLFFVCTLLPYGNDYKSAWVFLLAPSGALRGFARGSFAALFVPVIVVPHAILLVLFPWIWGAWHTVLFVAYSAAASAFYLGLDIRIVNGIPFTRQVDPKRGAALLPLMLVGGIGMSIAVGVQYLLVFRTAASASVATVVVGCGAFFLLRNSLRGLELAMRYQLAQLSSESGKLYQEVDA
jgi:hypothetical protein